MNLVKLAQATAFTLLAATGAQAAIVGISPNADLAGGPFTISLGGGAATYTFADSGARGGFFGNALPGVQTGGTAEVGFNPAILGGGVSTYFTDPGRRPFLSGSTLTNYMATTGLATIDAQTDSYIALSFDLGQGTQYGFARLSGLTLFDFAYETEAGQGIQTQPGPYTPIPDVAPVPLPASAGFLAFAIAGFAALRRRRQAA